LIDSSFNVAAGATI